jgi:hypothetical protein
MMATSDVLNRAADRHTLAIAMAAFEVDHEVVTQPYRKGEPLPHVFIINIPGKPKAQARAPKPRNPRNPRPNTLARQARISAIRRLATAARTIDEIAAMTQFTPPLARDYVAQLIWELGLPHAGRRKLKCL